MTLYSDTFSGICSERFGLTDLKHGVYAGGERYSFHSLRNPGSVSAVSEFYYPEKSHDFIVKLFSDTYSGICTERFGLTGLKLEIYPRKHWERI